MLRVSRVVIVVVAGVALVGCTPATSQVATQEPSLGSIPIVTSSEQVVLPIHSYLPSVEQNVAFMNAGKNFVNSCIQSEGGTEETNWFLEDDVTGVSREATQNDLIDFVSAYRRNDVIFSGMWGFFGVDTVAQHGYNHVEESSFYMFVGDGDTAMDSCFTRVNSVTPGTLGAGWPLQISGLPDGGPQWHPEDSRFVTVQEQWSQCMGTHGFAYATPDEAINSNVLAQTDAEKQKAKAVASADIQCKLDTNLVGVAVAVQSAYEQQYIDSHRDQLTEFQNQFAGYLAGRVTVPDEVPASGEPSMAHS